MLNDGLPKQTDLLLWKTRVNLFNLYSNQTNFYWYNHNCVYIMEKVYILTSCHVDTIFACHQGSIIHWFYVFFSNLTNQCISVYIDNTSLHMSSSSTHLPYIPSVCCTYIHTGMLPSDHPSDSSPICLTIKPSSI